MNNDQQMFLEKKIIAAIKRSCGYAEAEDKKAFLMGASVGMAATIAEFKPMIDENIAVRDSMATELTEVTGDMLTLVGIIHKYIPSP
jgi:hypothetical protein